MLPFMRWVMQSIPNAVDVITSYITLCILPFIVRETCPGENALSGILYLPDDQITASGFQEGYEPWNGRLESPIGWVADEPYSDNAYFQVRFNRYYYFFPLETNIVKQLIYTSFYD